MLVVSGAYADTVASRYPWYLPLATRIDCQVTIYTGDDRASHITSQMHAAAAEADRRPTNRRFKIDTYGQRGSIETVYIGSRSSSQFARIYDKEVQSRDAYYAGCVRYEVQFKAELARALGTEVYDSPLQPAYHCGPVVQAWFHQRGVSLPCVFSAPTFDLPRVGRPTDDDERALQWLHRQVRPSVSDLLTRVSRETIMYTLGLSTEDDSQMVYALEEINRNAP
jgi:hypothetical protein